MTFVRLFGMLYAVFGIGLLAPEAISAAGKPAACASGEVRQEGGKAKVDQLKKLKLIEKLNLDDATAEKFFVRYNAEQKKVDETRKALDEAMNELDKAKASGNSEKIKGLTEQTLQKHKQLQDATTDMLKSIRGVLSEKQYAEYLVFESKFQREITEILTKIKRENRKDSVKK